MAENQVLRRMSVYRHCGMDMSIHEVNGQELMQGRGKDVQSQRAWFDYMIDAYRRFSTDKQVNHVQGVRNHGQALLLWVNVLHHEMVVSIVDDRHHSAPTNDCNDPNKSQRKYCLLFRIIEYSFSSNESMAINATHCIVFRHRQRPRMSRLILL